ncbi:MAG: hypothetical protein AAGA80_01860 [Cyanobacteria bacterium P01_F01_bin.143]
MSDRTVTMFGFLGGTIMSVESGYKVLPHPRPDKVYQRLSDAKWFLAVRWCDDLAVPAAIINNTGELAFFNETVLHMGEKQFIPQEYRLDIFAQCLSLTPNETVTHKVSNPERILEIRALEIDPRYGKVALVRELTNQFNINLT